MNPILRDSRANEMPALKSAVVALQSVELADRAAIAPRSRNRSGG
jgi:hypothetical protein